METGNVTETNTEAISQLL